MSPASDAEAEIRLEFAFEARVTVGQPVDIGETPGGRRRFIPILGGTFEGPRLKGTVLGDGADWQILRGDGVTELEARYALCTDDGIVVSVFNRGLRHGPEDVMRRHAAGEPVDPGSYYFRTSFIFAAPSGRCDWMNKSIFVGAGVREPDNVIVRAYEVH